MVRPDKVEGKLENLRGYVQKLAHLASLPRKEFLSDFTKIESAKHLFQVSVEPALTSAIISSPVNGFALRKPMLRHSRSWRSRR